MNIDEIKTPDDVLEFMKKNIKYGWLDTYNELHIGNMKSFRSLYRTSTIDEILKYKIGTCIEQVWLMHHLLNKINITNKMFCCRIYEPNDYDKLEEEEHMHCFILYYKDDKIYQIEHPNWEKIGIYEYQSEEDALNQITNYYVQKSGGIERPTTEFNDVPSYLSFQQFNSYINDLGHEQIIQKLNMKKV